MTTLESIDEMEEIKKEEPLENMPVLTDSKSQLEANMDIIQNLGNTFDNRNKELIKANEELEATKVAYELAKEKSLLSYRLVVSAQNNFLNNKLALLQNQNSQLLKHVNQLTQKQSD